MSIPVSQFIPPATSPALVSIHLFSTSVTISVLQISSSVRFGGGVVSQVALVVKNLPASAGDLRDSGSIPGLGRYPRGGYGNPL